MSAPRTVFLTPPAGPSSSSPRSGWRAALPMLLILGAGVLLPRAPPPTLGLLAPLGR